MRAGGIRGAVERYARALDAVHQTHAQGLEAMPHQRVALDRDAAARTPGAVEPFDVTADLLHDFKQPSGARVAGVWVGEQPGARTWAELGIGAQRSLQPGVVLYGGLQVQHDLGGGAGRRSGVGGQLGLRARW